MMMFKFGYTENIADYDLSYYEKIEQKRWEAIQRRKFLIDGILQEVYTTLSSDKYKIVIPLETAQKIGEKIKQIVSGYYKGRLVCLELLDMFIKHIRLIYPMEERSEHLGLCLPYEELGLYVYSDSVYDSSSIIIKKRLEGKINDVVRNDDLIYLYFKMKILLKRQHRYIESCNHILYHFIQQNIQHSYQYMKWYNDRTSKEPIVFLTFSGRTYLYHGESFIHTPEEDIYTIIFDATQDKDKKWKLLRSDFVSL